MAGSGLSVLPADGEAILAPTLLSCLPSLVPELGEVTTVIETPKSSQNKYDYDDRLRGVRTLPCAAARKPFSV